MSQVPDAGTYLVMCPKCSNKLPLELNSTQTLFVCPKCGQQNLALLAGIRTKRQKTASYEGFSSRKFFVRVFTFEGEALISAFHSKLLKEPPDIILHSGDILIVTIRADGKKDAIFYNATVNKFYRAGKLLDAPLDFVRLPPEPTSTGCKVILWILGIMILGMILVLCLFAGMIMIAALSAGQV